MTAQEVKWIFKLSRYQAMHKNC